MVVLRDTMRQFDCGKRVILKFSNSVSRASYGLHHGLELPNYGMRLSYFVWDYTIVSFPKKWKEKVSLTHMRLHSNDITEPLFKIHHEEYMRQWTSFE